MKTQVFISILFHIIWAVPLNPDEELTEAWV